MHRARPIASVALAIALLVTVATPVVVAQTPDTATHPLVGAWFLDGDLTNDTNPPNLLTLHADGTVRDRSVEWSGLGAWVATGPESADLTILYPQADGAGRSIGSVIVRASISAGLDASSFSGTYTIEFPAGMTAQPGNVEIGPAGLSGSRVIVERMGVGGTADPGGRSDAPDVAITSTSDLGPFLVDRDGRTLYYFSVDGLGRSACTGTCAVTWPPLLVGPGVSPVGGAGVSGILGTIEREDGSGQVTYAGRPLYAFASDVAPGDTFGHGVGEVWFVAREDGTLGN